ncbi:MAG: porin family protein [Bacteroidetes bacterium]|nr:porin family protein [Bacteroidota bacterium]MDA1121741.1 porin family protein [Bacteroidota bacterium]
MLRKASLLFLLCSFYGGLDAQHSWYVGVRGGYNISGATVNQVILQTRIPTGQILGATGGLVVKHFPKPHFGIQGEVNITQKGYSMSFQDPIDQVITIFNYLEVPFMLNVYLGKRKWQFMANMGPFVGWMLSHKLTSPIDPATTQTVEYTYLYDPDRDKKFNYGLKLTAGLFREFSFGAFQIEGNFTLDIGNFLNPVTLDSGIPDNSRNTIYGISVTYLFPLGKRFTADD